MQIPEYSEINSILAAEVLWEFYIYVVNKIINHKNTGLFKGICYIHRC